MRIAIVGGALQGMEAVYLAKKAGFETLAIDKRDNAPALSLSDEHEVLDPSVQKKKAMKLFEDCDAVLPACEDLTLLRALDEMLSSSKIPLLFDIGSYMISSSKVESNRMMYESEIPIPTDWPGCGFPVIVKPSSQSGSIGVTVAYNKDDVDAGLKKIKEIGDLPVIQEFVSGKSVSMEAIGNGREFRSFVTTEIILDGGYDCKRVRCSPGILSKEKDDEFKAISEKMAERIGLKALMDVEAIDTAKGLRVIEIDARIPSQTPAAVLAATGINLLEELASPKFRKAAAGASSYEHFVIKDRTIMTCGEKEFAKVRNPRIAKGLFGSDEMITDHTPNADVWRGTMINSARSDGELEKKRARCIERIMSECDLERFIDTSPELV